MNVYTVNRIVQTFPNYMRSDSVCIKHKQQGQNTLAIIELKHEATRTSCGMLKLCLAAVFKHYYTTLH